AVREQRRQAAPHLSFPPALPISAHAERIGELVRRHQVVVLSGATGSGKSTQVPKILLAAGRGIDGRIGHTQPRRIAARAVARRLAAETGTAPGDLVGHAVRFDDNLSPATRVKVMTDGILLNEIERDPWLEQYDSLIIDEVHERSLNIDFLLGHLHRVLERRRNLRVVIMSATLDVEVFTGFFRDAVHHDVEGSSYPVELRYRPPEAAGDEEEPDINEAIVAAVAELDAVERADILVFLPGEREIREAYQALSRADVGETELLRLHARLGARQQSQVFEPGPQRRIILATNVAETSLTVPRIRHVIDTGLARVSRYSPRRKLQQLPVEKIARANADQRRGRCGREAPGVCIRLYAQADYERRRAAVEPEIQRTNLAGVILKLHTMGIDDIDAFPFAEPPGERLIKDAYNVLVEIGALDGERRLTDLGRELAAFPVDPRLARVLHAAAGFGCLAEALSIVAGLSISDPRERPHERREAADRAHQQFADKRSDFLWFVNAFSYAQSLTTMTQSKRQRQCRRRFLSAARMQEWVELRAYLERRARAAGHEPNAEPAAYRAVHLALAAGFPSAIGQWGGDGYHGCRGLDFALHPSSVLHRRGVKWVLVGDVVETARPYARLAARIDPRWLERVAGHLIRRSYEAPRWDPRLGCARVTQISRLLGLVIEADREIDLARVDARAARALLLEAGLLDGELGEMPDFLAHNRAQVKRIQDLEARARRRDLLAPRERLAAFYDGRIPASITTRRDLLRWLRADPTRAAALYMEEQDACSDARQGLPEYLFPEVLQIAGAACPLSYRFEPGHARDGICVRVPLALLPQVREAMVDRLVPGLLSEKIEAMVRALPKELRRRLSPAREYAMAALEALAERDGPLDAALAAIFSEISGHAFSAADFAATALPAHLRMLIDVVAEDGETLVASGRDLEALSGEQAAAALARRERIDWGIGGRSTAGWTFGELPTEVRVDEGGTRINAFVALVDAGDAVEVAVFDGPAAAAAAHVAGLARLLLLGAERESRYLERSYAGNDQLALAAALFGFRETPVRPLLEAVALARAATRPATRDAQAFATLAEDFRRAVVAEVGTAIARLEQLFERGRAVRAALEQQDGPKPRESVDDIHAQLGELLGPGILPLLVADGAARHDRYLDALERRLERLAADPGKDLRKLAVLAPLWRRYLAAAGTAGAEERRRVHRLLEELRISLFAPELGAAGKVSPALVETALAGLGEGRECPITA
ncbi:MAG: ATP-dependent RNA helicase HrpA, partial [Gammaproteobacteria bacterium]